MAVRSNQHYICENLLPERHLLLQTRLCNQVTRLSPTLSQSQLLMELKSRIHIASGRLSSAEPLARVSITFVSLHPSA